MANAGRASGTQSPMAEPSPATGAVERTEEPSTCRLRAVTTGWPDALSATGPWQSSGETLMVVQAGAPSSMGGSETETV